MGAPLTAEEQTRVLSYLGYPDFEALGPSISFGYPSASQPLFIVRDAFNRISPTARDRVRDDLCRLDQIEALIGKNAVRAGVESAGDVRMNSNRGHGHLIRERKRLVRRLCDDLGVFPNPHSQMFGVGDVRVMNT